MTGQRWPAEAHVADALSAFLDGELTPAARRETEAHLSTCPQCREELDLIAAARAAVRALAVRPPPPDRWAELVGDPAHGRFPRRVGWAAAAAVAAVIAVFLPREPDVAPALPALVDSHAARASVTGDPLTQLAPIAVPVSFGP